MSAGTSTKRGAVTAVDLADIPADVLLVAAERARRRTGPAADAVAWRQLPADAQDAAIAMMVGGQRPALGWWRDQLAPTGRAPARLRVTGAVVAAVVADMARNCPGCDPAVTVDLAMTEGLPEDQAIGAFRDGLAAADRQSP